MFLDDLLLRLDFRDPDPEVIDLSPQGGLVSTLKESKVECLSTDRVRYSFPVPSFLTHLRTLIYTTSSRDTLEDPSSFCRLLTE